MRRTGRAVWHGDVYEGHGVLTTDSGVLENTPYSLTTRTEDESGTSPEELLATAHAGCFNMALSFILGKAGYQPERLETNATISFEMTEQGLRINRVKLDLVAMIPGIERTTFMELAGEASRTCTISAVLKAQVTVNFRLVS
jgi:osmotically inducible protein OsmC